MKKSIFAVFASVFLSGVALASPVGGPKHASGVLPVGESSRYFVPLEGGEPVVVKGQGDGDGNLDCFLYDNHDNLVAFDTGPADSCALSGTPLYTAIFRLVLTNHGTDVEAFEVLVL